jgi:hypothetical protein
MYSPSTPQNRYLSHSHVNGAIPLPNKDRLYKVPSNIVGPKLREHDARVQFKRSSRQSRTNARFVTATLVANRTHKPVLSSGFFLRTTPDIAILLIILGVVKHAELHGLRTILCHPRPRE